MCYCSGSQTLDRTVGLQEHRNLFDQDGRGRRDTEPDRRETSGHGAGTGGGLGDLEPRGGSVSVPRHDRTQARG